MDAAIQRNKPIKTLNRDKVGEDALFAYDEAKRMLTVCASAKVSSMSLVKVGDPDMPYCLLRCNFTRSCSMKLSDPSKVKGVPSVLFRGIARQISQFCNCLLYVEATRWCWWTPTRRSEYFLSSHSNSGELFVRTSLMRFDRISITDSDS
jgi:hypothetical protein